MQGIEYTEANTSFTTSNNTPKLLIIGMGRHGKDTMAEILREEFGYKFNSSSEVACKTVIWDKLKDRYASLEECFKDRHNHREEWFNLISEYNKDNKSRLAEDILKISSCYVGMRDRSEFEACKKRDLFDLIIWVDATDRVDFYESNNSMKLTKKDADIVIENNSSLEDFREKVIRLGKFLNL